MSLSVEELLKPRYKVIADYPGSNYCLGKIIQQPRYKNAFTEKYWCEINDMYPHLFRKMQWWEERSESDMPEYFCDPDKTIFHKGHVDINDTSEWCLYFEDVETSLPYLIRYWQPATAQSYLQYIESNK